MHATCMPQGADMAGKEGYWVRCHGLMTQAGRQGRRAERERGGANGWLMEGRAGLGCHHPRGNQPAAAGACVSICPPPACNLCPLCPARLP